MWRNISGNTGAVAACHKIGGPYHGPGGDPLRIVPQGGALVLKSETRNVCSITSGQDSRCLLTRPDFDDVTIEKGPLISKAAAAFVATAVNCLLV